MKEYGAGKLEFFILGIGKIIFKQDKFALLWGEAQLCVPYVCL